MVLEKTNVATNNDDLDQPGGQASNDVIYEDFQQNHTEISPCAPPIESESESKSKSESQSESESEESDGSSSFEDSENDWNYLLQNRGINKANRLASIECGESYGSIPQGRSAHYTVILEDEKNDEQLHDQDQERLSTSPVDQNGGLSEDIPLLTNFNSRMNDSIAETALNSVAFKANDPTETPLKSVLKSASQTNDPAETPPKSIKSASQISDPAETPLKSIKSASQTNDPAEAPLKTILKSASPTHNPAETPLKETCLSQTLPHHNQDSHVSRNSLSEAPPSVASSSLSSGSSNPSPGSQMHNAILRCVNQNPPDPQYDDVQNEANHHEGQQMPISDVPYIPLPSLHHDQQMSINHERPSVAVDSLSIYGRSFPSTISDSSKF